MYVNTVTLLKRRLTHNQWMNTSQRLSNGNITNNMSIEQLKKAYMITINAVTYDHLEKLTLCLKIKEFKRYRRKAITMNKDMYCIHANFKTSDTAGVYLTSGCYDHSSLAM